jgi:glycosyltransferase involved in cell wall biosynthesis
MKLAAIATHPIQYQAPLWRAITASEQIDLKVFFATRHGLEASSDLGFGKTFAWDIPLVEGYDHEFLPACRVPGFPEPVANHFPRGLSKKIREHRCDAVLVNGYGDAAAWAGMLAAWRTRTPVIMRGDSHEHGRTKSVRLRLKRMLLPRLLRHVDGFLAIGTWNREYWESYGVPKNRIETALFAVDNDFFVAGGEEHTEQTRCLRSKWGVPVDGTVFLYCAKLISVKAPDVLLRAFSLLADPKAHLIFVGSGQMEAPLKELQRELGIARVHWEGFMNQSALPRYYRAADVLILPSRFEPWGLVVNEAMACGTPCLVSDVVGAGADLVVGKDAGLVFPHDNVNELASALRTALNQELRRRWERNLAPLIDKATFTQNATALRALMEAVVSRSGKTKATAVANARAPSGPRS